MPTTKCLNRDNNTCIFILQSLGCVSLFVFALFLFGTIITIMTHDFKIVIMYISIGAGIATLLFCISAKYCDRKQREYEMNEMINSEMMV